MHTETLAKMAHGCQAVIELLLTWLGVGARHGPRSFRRHPRQQKLWRARSCSSTSLLLRKSSMSGGPPSEALSAPPTKTSHGQHSVEPPHASSGGAGGAAATVHSPPPRQPLRVSVRRDDACDNISIASSDPRTHRDHRQFLRERAHEDARTTIEHRRDTRHQSDRRAGLSMDHPASGGSSGLPTRWAAQPLPMSYGSSSGPPPACSNQRSRRNTTTRLIRPSS